MSLRVIAGLRKGYKLKGPRGKDSRPTEDRIKENIFNILDLSEDENFIALDLFSCTGNIGIEFLSRGAKKVYFSEYNKQNIELIKENLEHTKFLEKSEILFGYFKKNIMRITEKIDYVYIDPPYKSEYYEQAFKIMLKKDNFNDSLFITEIDKEVDFSDRIEDVELIYEKKYGKKHIGFYRRVDESSISR